jgi:hypothetical protein
MILPLLFAAAAAPVPQHLKNLTAEVEETFSIDVDLRVQKCGMENAWYDIQDDTVTICTELLDRPLLARAILRHELGHALNDQWDIPWKDYEVFADEFMLLTSTPEELTEIAKWHMHLFEVDGPTSPGDPHPDHMDRAWAALCFADEGDRACEVYKRSVWGGWVRLLEAVESLSL